MERQSLLWLRPYKSTIGVTIYQYDFRTTEYSEIGMLHDIMSAYFQKLGFFYYEGKGPGRSIGWPTQDVYHMRIDKTPSGEDFKLYLAIQPYHNQTFSDESFLMEVINILAERDWNYTMVETIFNRDEYKFIKQSQN